MFSSVADRERLRLAARRRRNQAFRPGTRGNHWSHALLYIAFCLYFGCQDFPAGTEILILFGEFLTRSYTAHKSVTNVISSLRTLLLMWGFVTDGFDSFQLTMWKRALPLTLRFAPTPAPPLPFAVLLRLCGLARALGSRGRTFAALLVTAFFSLARLSSLVPNAGGVCDTSRVPLLGDLVDGDEGLSLLLKWGKAAQDPGQGFWVPLLPVTGSPACPVAALRALRGSLRGSPSTLPLFSFAGEAGGHRPRVLTMGAARLLLARLLGEAGLGNKGYTFHSLRRGGCTLAFSAGATLSDLQLLGGWRSRAIEAYFPHVEARTRAARVLVGASAASLRAPATTPFTLSL